MSIKLLKKILIADSLQIIHKLKLVKNHATNLQRRTNKKDNTQLITFQINYSDTSTIFLTSLLPWKRS